MNLKKLVLATALCTLSIAQVSATEVDGSYLKARILGLDYGYQITETTSIEAGVDLKTIAAFADISSLQKYAHLPESYAKYAKFFPIPTIGARIVVGPKFNFAVSDKVNLFVKPSATIGYGYFPQTKHIPHTLSTFTAGAILSAGVDGYVSDKIKLGFELGVGGGYCQIKAKRTTGDNQFEHVIKKGCFLERNGLYLQYDF